MRVGDAKKLGNKDSGWGARHSTRPPAIGTSHIFRLSENLGAGVALKNE